MTPSKLSLIKVWIFSVALAAGLSSLTACQKEKKPSVLILAVDRLAFSTYSCGDDKQNSASGLNILCKEAIRFTHAYTTSTQPAAAIGSLLTGLYPAQHQLHRNFDRLDSKYKTIQEQASNLGYQTYFFGGSPSILKKTGLSVGFDIFDDSSFIEKKTYFMDFKIQGDKFLHAASEDKNLFFSVIHNSELESLNEGESEISSIEKLDEKLFHFFVKLKKQKIWDKNYIIVVGLQGESDYRRLSETPFSNLNSENTRVTLFVKPPRSKGDEGIFWKVDSPVNLADLGYSMWLTLGDVLSPNKNNLDLEFPIYDISSTWLNQSKTTILPVRHLLIETMDTWSAALFARFSIIYKNLLFIEDTKNHVYNTLTDGLESIDISAKQEQFITESIVSLNKLRTNYQLGLWQNHQSKWNEWVLSNREYWSKPNSRALFLKKELERLNSNGESQPLSALLLKHLVETKKTKSLKNISVESIPLKLGMTLQTQQDWFYENAKLHSINLALENIWGLWEPKKEWLYSDLILENQ